MKNKQIHEQDQKITELEKIVGFKFLLGFMFPKFSNRAQRFCTSFEEFNVALPFPCVFEQAEKNVYLKERLQVMEQQNEDLKERIDKNVAVSRLWSF